MSIPQRAIIRWLPPSEGGRAHPPAGPVYSTVARFPEHPSQQAWSLVVKFVRALADQSYTDSEVGFLADAAPSELLRPGARFELVEGAQRVAKGVILPRNARVPNELSDFESALIG